MWVNMPYMDGMGMELFQNQTDIKFQKLLSGPQAPTIVMNRESWGRHKSPYKIGNSFFHPYKWSYNWWLYAHFAWHRCHFCRHQTERIQKKHGLWQVTVLLIHTTCCEKETRRRKLYHLLWSPLHPWEPRAAWRDKKNISTDRAAWNGWFYSWVSWIC